MDKIYWIVEFTCKDGSTKLYGGYRNYAAPKLYVRKGDATRVAKGFGKVIEVRLVNANIKPQEYAWEGYADT